MTKSPYPILNARARGWLRHLWDKATTPDDWTSGGVPHPWWDRSSTDPMCSFPRFDLSESVYALIMMADQTPAWREGYSRIADELCRRHTTHWAAVDWLTQIGHDPRRKDYPAWWRGGLIPDHLWGEYDTPGWTANGIEPWGLQPDPIGSDGNLFFRGFFNLMLSTYRYISGDDKWERPFAVVGYQDSVAEWTHTRIVELLQDQWTRRPEGPHCENTKVWPYCLSAAGLGMQLYDKICEKRSHVVYENWLEYARKHYMSVSSDGKLERFTLYYDPILKYNHAVGPTASLGTCLYMLPQHREFAQFLFEAGVNAIGWSDPKRAVHRLRDPRMMAIAIVLAREFGDHTTEARLLAVAEKEFQPLFFGEGDDRFGWWFNLGEAFPRGQLSSLMMMMEVGTRGDWARAFADAKVGKFAAPTVEEVEFPKIGVAQAWNDPKSGTLNVVTYAATSSLRGTSTPWRITNLPDPSKAVVTCDGELFERTRVTEDGALEIQAAAGEYSYQIHTGYHGPVARDGDSRQRLAMGRRRRRPARARATGSRESSATSTAPTSLLSASARRCPCCSV